MKSALFICDPNWSTGNVVKGLQVILRDWRIEMHDWREPFVDTEHDAVVCMSMTGPARNPPWCTPRMAHVLCGPGEMDLPEVQALQLPPGMVLSGVSVECRNLLIASYSNVDNIYTTPGFAHPHIFTFRARPDRPIRRAGFVGTAVAQNMQVSGPAKRPEMFQAICDEAGIEALYSGHEYRYEDMQKFYDGIDVLISTSSREGGPFSPMEAIACGVPALSTDVGVIHDLALPGRFNTVEECAALIPRARSLLPAQLEVADRHMHEAPHAWNAFLDRAATVRAAT